MLPYYLSGAITHFPMLLKQCVVLPLGSSVILNIEGFPNLCFSEVSQWVGGIGIVVFVMAFLPIFGGRAIQLSMQK